MMANIQVLSPHLADLIAAGEVVERPASVAKELLENAIDAGATKVTVEIAHGGMSFIRVTDNGKGIPAEELATAFLRHATSKLRNQRDLECIGTLGFRGEALAAISAVSRIEVTSKTSESALGACLLLDGGTPLPIEEAGCPTGTTMVVRDLFFNTPARLKFMKKDAFEGAAVYATVQRVALSHPEVGVTFIRDGKQEMMTSGDGLLKSALYAVMSRELALGFIPIEGSGEDMSVSGFVSMPTCCRGSRNYQHFFVNGRYIKSRTMMAALEEAYKNSKMVGKFPGCAIHLTLSPSAVDVNVHPAKIEVKFHNERQVFQTVYHGVRFALDGNQIRPTMTIATPKETVEKMQKDTSTVKPQELLLNDFFTKQDEKMPVTRINPIWDTTSTIPRAPRPPLPTPITEKKMSEHIIDTPPVIIQEAMDQDMETIIPWKLAGEVLNTYIIVEQGEKILFIDKHAAHERMNFDRMKAEGYTPMMQTLLAPVVLRLDGEELLLLLQNLSLLEEFGFIAEDFGGTLLVREAPFDVAIEDIEPTLLELAEILKTTGTANPQSARDDMFHTKACKAAIKGGWNTSPEELHRVAEAVVSGRVKHCPHGRPVAIEMTKYQLEKQFKRA